MLLLLAMLTFNSIKVQFRLIDAGLNPAFMDFQFHKGTIKALVVTQALQEIASFNSIKVQLRPVLSIYFST